MAEGRRREAWSGLASLEALLANCHRDPKKTRAFRPGDFDPFARKQTVPKVPITVLKDVFIDGKWRRHGG